MAMKEIEINGQKFSIDRIQDLTVAVKVEGSLIAIPIEMQRIWSEALKGISQKDIEGGEDGKDFTDKIDLMSMLNVQTELSSVTSIVRSKFSQEQLTFINASLFSGVKFFRDGVYYPLMVGSSYAVSDVVNIDNYDELFDACVEVNFKAKWGKKFPMFLAAEKVTSVTA